VQAWHTAGALLNKALVTAYWRKGNPIEVVPDYDVITLADGGAMHIPMIQKVHG
jgi:hypothetical protein